MYLLQEENTGKRGIFFLQQQRLRQFMNCWNGTSWTENTVLGEFF